MAHILLFTLAVAAISTICIAPVALALAAWSWRAGTKGLVLDAIGALPLVLPPTAVGFVLLEILSRRSAIGALLDRIGIEILFTPRAVVLACAVMSFPLMFTAFRVAIETSERRYFDVARTLGASPLRALVRVTLPLAWRGLLSGILLAFCRSLGEFGATILIAGNIPGRTQTMALAIYDRVQSGNDHEAAILVGVVVGIAWVLVSISSILIVQQRRRLAA
ncbi:MAG: molybdate transport system permease protein [Thermoanaerobaculia bacterium]|jgi:molybdate transport system permease protein|nr:molybdate transport system permease protein [Thermoanaerobaculia bacterium]